MFIIFTKTALYTIFRHFYYYFNTLYIVRGEHRTSFWYWVTKNKLYQNSVEDNERFSLCTKKNVLTIYHWSQLQPSINVLNNKSSSYIYHIEFVFHIEIISIVYRYKICIYLNESPRHGVKIYLKYWLNKSSLNKKKAI